MCFPPLQAKKTNGRQVRSAPAQLSLDRLDSIRLGSAWFTSLLASVILLFLSLGPLAFRFCLFACNNHNHHVASPLLMASSRWF